MWRIVVPTALVVGLLFSTLGTATAQTAAQPAFPFTTNGPSAADNVVLAHNNAFLSAVRAHTDPPPLVAWKMTVLNTAMYDAWAAYHATATPVVTSGWSRRTGPAVDRIEAMSQAALAVAPLVYPNSVAVFEARAAQVRAAHGTGSADAQAFGAAVGRAAYEARAGDLQYANNSGGTAPDPSDPFNWRPLPGQPANGLYPRWGNVRPFALPAGWQSTAPYTPDGPATNPGTYYNRQTQDIVLKTQNLTDRQKAMAIYWADGPRSETPPGHWNLIAQTVSRARKHSLDKDVELFLTLSTALLDAGIASWNCKYHYNWTRPTTLIWHQYAGQTVRLWDGRPRPGGQWASYVPTPPFPEYTSGHSTFSGAAARVLGRVTGTDALPAGLQVVVPKGSHPRQLTPGVPMVTASDPTTMNNTLTWASYTAMARDAGLSRLLGGIHFTDADVEGRGAGDAIGTAAHARVRAHLTGAT
jgi:PAP2 superfamily